MQSSPVQDPLGFLLYLLILDRLICTWGVWCQEFGRYPWGQSWGLRPCQRSWRSRFYGSSRRKSVDWWVYFSITRGSWQKVPNVIGISWDVWGRRRWRCSFWCISQPSSAFSRGPFSSWAWVFALCTPVLFLISSAWDLNIIFRRNNLLKRWQPSSPFYSPKGRASRSFMVLQQSFMLILCRCLFGVQALKRKEK